jgi:N-acetyl-anhydromuramyl-L-alanine amidase AmpD
MKITVCLLNVENTVISGNVSIGKLIASSGKRQLWEERPGNVVDVIVIHYTSAAALAQATPFSRELILKLFCDYGVSSHYLIDRGGGVDLLVPEDMKAWHAGGSIMPPPDNRQAVNEFSVGIELMATAASGFAAPQYVSLARLCAEIERRHGRKFLYVGHDQIAGDRAVSMGLRKEKKVDPGRLFDWDVFSKQLEGERNAERVA